MWCEHGAFVIPMAGGAAKTVEGAIEAEVGVGWGGGAVTGWATNVGFTGWKVGLTGQLFPPSGSNNTWAPPSISKMIHVKPTHLVPQPAVKIRTVWWKFCGNSSYTCP